MQQLVFDPRIPLALWVALAVAALIAWLGYAWMSRTRLPRPRRAWVLALMAATLTIPLAILLNPTWLEYLPPPAGKPRLTILVDTSASMATADADQQ